MIIYKCFVQIDYNMSTVPCVSLESEGSFNASIIGSVNDVQNAVNSGDGSNVSGSSEGTFFPIVSLHIL